MAHITIKPHADRDFYVVWSTISDSPYMWGSKKEFKKALKKTKLAFRLGEHFMKSIDEADLYGANLSAIHWFDWEPDSNFEVRYGMMQAIYRHDIPELTLLMEKKSSKKTDKKIQKLLHNLYEDDE